MTGRKLSFVTEDEDSVAVRGGRPHGHAVDSAGWGFVFFLLLLITNHQTGHGRISPRIFPKRLGLKLGLGNGGVGAWLRVMKDASLAIRTVSSYPSWGRAQHP